ncbi:alkylphosphonate utilization protein [Hymenobacter psoromatis]|uniref:alkylphosphonate utilization protein n=1 Tax=Hymenobacter psoromatis TaxID=1484116 RepID=UPI001CBE43FE|nr:alkylphosphonate utilization protein [Hymenobacter psoromatis]
MNVKGSNGTLLTEGDAVTLIKDLKVRGSSQTLKRGTLVKNIRLTNSPAEVEGRAGGSTMVLKTEFLKKA